MRAAWMVFLLVFGLSIAWLVARKDAAPDWRALDGVFIFFAGLMSVWLVAKRLPIENVAAAGLIVLGTSAVAIATFAYYGTSLENKIGFTSDFGPSLLNSNQKRLLPWPVPFLVLGLTFSSRETARLLLRRWRREKNYGLLLMGVSGLLVVLVCSVLEPFAKGVWWTWPEDANSFWFGLPWIAFVCWYALAVVVYWFAGPWLIVKRPLAVVPDLSPVGLWLLITLYFVIGNALKDLKAQWPAVAVGLITCAAAGFLSWREWRNAQPQPTPVPAPASSNADA